MLLVMWRRVIIVVICLPSVFRYYKMPISAQQWRVSVGLFNCSRMRWLMKGGGGAKMTAPPSSSRSNTHAVKRGLLPLLYLLMLACAMPPRLLLIQSGDVELNPGPVETGEYERTYLMCHTVNMAAQLHS